MGTDVQDLEVAPARWRAAGLDLLVSGVAAGGLFVAVVLARRLGLIDVRMHGLLLPAMLHVALGWFAVTSGRIGVRGLWRAVLGAGVGPLLARAVVLGAAWLLTAAAFARGTQLSLRFQLFAITAVLVTLGVAGLRRLRPSDLDARTAVSALLAVYVAAFAWSGVLKVEAYPLAPFQMYSVPRLDPYTTTVPRLLATTADGETVDLTRTAGGATVRTWLADPDAESTAAAVQELATNWEQRSGRVVVSLEVVSETWLAPPHPAEPRVELVESEVVLRADH